MVIDASVVAKWFNLEELTENAVRVKEAHVSGALELSAPIHLSYEVGNAIWRNNQLSDNDAINAIESLKQLDLILIATSQTSVKRTMEIARMRQISYYDVS